MREARLEDEWGGWGVEGGVTATATVGQAEFT